MTLNKNNAKKSTKVRRPKVVAGPSRPQAENLAPTSENQSAWRMVRALKGPNHKYINSLGTAVSTTASITTPAVVLLNGVGTGTNENTRIGRLCRHHWLDLDLDIENTGTVLGVDFFRLYIVVETTALGSALQPTQFFVDNTNFLPTSQRDRTNRNASRYMVLYDSKAVGLGAGPGASGFTAPSWSGVHPIGRSFNLHLPLNFDTDYSRGVSGTISDIETNSLYLMVVSDNGNPIISVTGGFTTCFSDRS